MIRAVLTAGNDRHCHPSRRSRAQDDFEICCEARGICCSLSQKTADPPRCSNGIVDARERLAAARGMTVSKQFREAVLEAICFLFFYD
jgi:hypothetical protein